MGNANSGPRFGQGERKPRPRKARPEKVYKQGHAEKPNPGSGRTRKNPNIPWPGIKHAFITSYRSAASIAVEFGVPAQIVEARVWSESWIAQRAEYFKDLHDQSVKRTREQRVREVVAIRSIAADIALDGLANLKRFQGTLGRAAAPRDVRDAINGASEAFELALKGLGLEAVKIDGEEMAQVARIQVAWAPNMPPEVMLAEACKQLGKDPKDILKALGLEMPDDDPTA